jgi:ribosomal protein L16 Arg81 hydroxylase
MRTLEHMLKSFLQEEEEETTAVAATEKDQEMEVEMDEEEMDLVEQGMRATVIEEEGEKVRI